MTGQDDKELIAAFAIQEAQRLSERLKNLVSAGTPPTQAQADEVTKDIQQTLTRVQSALTYAANEITAGDTEKHDKPS